MNLQINECKTRIHSTMTHTAGKKLLRHVESNEEFDCLRPNAENWINAVREVASTHGLSQDLILFPYGTNIVYACGADRVIKLFPPLPVHLEQFESESRVLRHVQGKISMKTPTLEFSGDIEGWPYLVMSRLSGKPLEDIWANLTFDNKVLLLEGIAKVMKEVHQLPIDGLEPMDSHWPQFLEGQISQCVERHQRQGLSDTLLAEIPVYLEEAKPFLPKEIRTVLLTGEYTPFNLLANESSGTWHLDGMIDFADCMLGYYEYDLVGPGAFLIQGDKRLIKRFLISYGYSLDEMDAKLRHRLMALTLLHRYSNLDIQVRIENWKYKAKTLKELEQLVWGT